MSQDAAAGRPRGPDLIELRDVSIRFRYESVLRNINLAIKAGETVCIIGESGCGKTVMLKLIIGLLRSPHSGAPTRPVPTSPELLSSVPTLRGLL